MVLIRSKRFNEYTFRRVSKLATTITNPKREIVLQILVCYDSAPSHSVARLAKHLTRHGVEVVSEDVKSNGHAIGQVFKDYVSTHKADLLIMGAYGHSRIREFILGGATKSILLHPPTWVLLSH
jgi:nucleotide-binding universal stress UspA family protein